MDILYLCDGKACGDICPNPHCHYTSKIEHAKNFAPKFGYAFYAERENTMDEMNTTENIPMKDTPIEAPEAKERAERRATRRFYKFLDTIYKIAQLSGFRIEGRIVVKDIRTGKVFK